MCLNHDLDDFLVRSDIFAYNKEHFKLLKIQMSKDHEFLRVRKNH